MAQDGVHAHIDALGRVDSDRTIAAIDLDAVARARVIPGSALDITVRLMPLNLGQSSISQPDVSSFIINQQSYNYFSEQTNL